MDSAEVVQKLARRFGWGGDRDRRSALYQRVARAIEEGGDGAYAVVSTVASEAKDKQHPDRYFCFVVLRRLAERGFLVVEDL